LKARFCGNNYKEDIQIYLDLGGKLNVYSECSLLAENGGPDLHLHIHYRVGAISQVTAAQSG
jgi:hypothetical protein